MNVETLIRELQERARPDDEVTLIVEDGWTHEVMMGVFTGKVTGTGTGAETGKCEIYGIE